AFFKALLFMGAGAVMHAMHDELNIMRMGGLRTKMPFTYWTFLIGVLAIIGTPPFSGFFSKEDVIGAAYSRALHGDGWLWIVWALTIFTACLTAIYMFRLFFLVFHGEPRDRELYDHAHDAGLAMKVPMGILAVLSIVGGLPLSFPGVYNEMEAWLSPVFHRFPVGGPALVPQPFYLTSMIVTLLVTALGVLVAWQIYYRAQPGRQQVAAIAPGVYRLLYHKWYVDELYDLVFVRPIKFSGRMIYRFFELDLVDATVDGIGKLTRWLSGRVRTTETGYVRNYALSILFGAVLIAAYYVIGGR
ncbi:MAG: NADH-quinone oxidoreductase subunit L, partial [Chloroflexi bacterium]|nr:NADH-quinone oxidoreductase subunit L [Chloroflexota bacterium]